MPFLIADTQPLWWSCQLAGETLAAGVTEPGGLTVTGIDLIFDSDENTFLGAVVGSATTYNPLPDSGFLQAGEIYGWNGGLVIVRQSHNRTEFAPDATPALFIVWRENETETLDWISGEQVYVGTRRLYNAVEYECLQTHVTQTDWFPSAIGILGVLWSVLVLTVEWQTGVAYTVNQEVAYQGSTYRCLQAHTSIVTWCPTCAGILNVLWALV